MGYAPEEQTATYTSFDKLCTLEQGTKSLTLTYGYDFNRRKTVFTDGSTTKTKIFVPGGYEKITEGGSKEFCYISTPAGLTAVYDKTNDEMFYVHPDHLGSIHFITDESGSVEQELSFDAWGRQRNATNWGYSSLPTPKFERGYTFHEHLSEFDLINMNGRVYDPMIARFLSPDPVLQSPGNLQNYNRYSYCFNNPLIYTDPSGEKLRWPKFRRHHWIPIIGQFNYLMEFINDNTVKLRQNMVDAGIPDFNIGGSVNSDGEVTVYAGIGTGDGNMLAISYNSNNGVGFGNANNSGNNQFYYPSVNYNAPEQNAVAGINEGISKYYRAESNFQNFRDEYWALRTSFEVGRLIYTGWAQEGWNFDSTKDDTWYSRSEALINIYPESWFFGAKASIGKVQRIDGGVRLSRYNLRLQSHTHSINPIPGRGFSGSKPISHFNINEFHIIYNIKNWKGWSTIPYLPIRYKIK